MNFSLNGIFSSLKNIWQKFTPRQRVITIVVPAITLVLLLSLVWWTGRPVYTALFQGPITADEAGGVVNKLKELKISYQLADGGTSVLVPKANVAEARIQLASAGIPTGSKFSFANLNSSMNFGETDADRKLKYTLGLQDELETTLKTLAAIDDARVHLALPEKSLFIEQQKEPTAGVTVKMKPGGALTQDQLRGITNLLANSVEGLKPEKVSIIDTSGQLLSEKLDAKKQGNLSVTQVQLQQSVQDGLEHSAQAMLDKALGQGKSIVKVVTDLDFDQVQVTKESYGNNALRSRQNSQESTTSSTAGTSGVPGTNSNIPSYQSINSGNGLNQSSKTQTNENFEIDKTQETRVVNPGSIKRLSVSVLLDQQSADAKTIQTVKDIITPAVGLNTVRGDQIQVAAIPFNTSANDKYLEAEKKAMDLQAQRQIYYRYGALAAVALGLLAFGIIAIRRRRKKMDDFLDEPFTQAPVAAALGLGDDHSDILGDLFKQKVQLANDTHPGEVAKVIKIWLQDESEVK